MLLLIYLAQRLVLSRSDALRYVQQQVVIIGGRRWHATKVALCLHDAGHLTRVVNRWHATKVALCLVSAIPLNRPRPRAQPGISNLSLTQRVPAGTLFLLYVGRFI